MSVLLTLALKHIKCVYTFIVYWLLHNFDTEFYPTAVHGGVLGCKHCDYIVQVWLNWGEVNTIEYHMNSISQPFQLEKSIYYMYQLDNLVGGETEEAKENN